MRFAEEADASGMTAEERALGEAAYERALWEDSDDSEAERTIKTTGNVPQEWCVRRVCLMAGMH